MPGDIYDVHILSGVILVSSRWKPRVLVNILQCIKLHPARMSYVIKMSVVLRLVHSALDAFRQVGLVITPNEEFIGETFKLSILPYCKWGTSLHILNFTQTYFSFFYCCLSPPSLYFSGAPTGLSLILHPFSIKPGLRSVV